jgi:hypothetical protein
MSDTTKTPFRWRAFWSLLLIVTTVGLAWSGVQNHELGLDGLTTARHAWMSAHNTLALLFVVAVAAHVVLNGKALLRHAHGLAARLPSREAMVALAVTAGLLLLAVGHAGIAGDRGGPEHGAERSGNATR